MTEQTNQLSFKKKSVLNNIECGYYFKGELLSRYKTQALQILRERIEKAGSQVGDMSQTNFEKGMKVLPDEYAIVHQHYLESTEKNRKTKEKKKVYYATMRRARLESDIAYLQQLMQSKIEAVRKDFEKKIAEKRKLLNDSFLNTSPSNS